MADYTQSTLFGPKDGLSSGDPLKLARGTEVDAELSAIATAIASKLDDESPTAGAGLALASGVLSVGAGTGITVNANDVELDIAGLTLQGSAAATGDFVAIELAGGGKRRVTVTNLVAGTGFVPNSRALTAGIGLTGLGDLSADRTIDLDLDSLTPGSPINTDQLPFEDVGTGPRKATIRTVVRTVEATEAETGVVERATQAEVDAGSDTTRYISPATLSSFSGLPNVPIEAIKTSDTSRSSQTTPADDPDLSGFSLEANSSYKIEAHLLWDGESGGANASVLWQTSNPGQDDGGTYITGDTSTGNGDVTGYRVDNELTITVHTLPMNNSGFNTVTIFRGFVNTGGNATVMDFQWAQDVSNVNALSLRAGSWVSFTKIG